MLSLRCRTICFSTYTPIFRQIHKQVFLFHHKTREGVISSNESINLVLTMLQPSIRNFWWPSSLVTACYNFIGTNQHKSIFHEFQFFTVTLEWNQNYYFVRLRRAFHKLHFFKSEDLFISLDTCCYLHWILLFFCLKYFVAQTTPSPL